MTTTDKIFQKSSQLLEKGKKYEALIEARPDIFWTGMQRVGGQPIFARRAKGSRVYDVDGNALTDFVLGYGSVILGHANDATDEAAIECIRNGVNPTLLSAASIELAETISSLVPNADRATFFKTGSDATSAAIRVACAATRRSKILSFGFHGWHDWCSESRSVQTSPHENLLTKFKYNDFEEISRLFKKYGDEIAAVIMMPYEVDLPEEGYLEHIRALCHHFGSLLIFDEIRSGFRISIGGAQKYFSIDADLVCIGKAMANGYAISALAGRSEVMRHSSAIGHTVTFPRSPLSMVAALATIQQLINTPALEHINLIGCQLKAEFNEIARIQGISVTMNGCNSTPNIQFSLNSANDNQKAKSLFSNAMLSHGFIIHPNHHLFISASHQSTDVSEFIMSAKSIFASKSRYW